MTGRGRIASFLVALALVASACGSRLPDDVLARLDQGASSQLAASAGGEVASGPASGGGSETVTQGSGGQQRTSSSGPAAGSQGGSGATGGTGEKAAEENCVPSDETSTGVTPTEIHVASIVTDSGPLPGATTNSYRAAAAYIAMVNAQGGVCGRKIVLEMGDDGLDASRARAEFTRLEPKVAAFVGAFAVADQGYVDLIDKTEVPYLGVVVDPAGRNVKNALPAAGSGTVNTGPYVHYRQANPGIDRVGLLYLDIAGVRENRGQVKYGLPRVGFTLVYEAALGAATPDYTAEVRALQDNDVQFLYLFAVEVNQQVRLIRNMRQQNYDPPLKAANVANARLTDLLGTDADGWQFDMTHLPIFDPGEAQRSPAVGTFSQWSERTFPGEPTDFFSIYGWVNAAYFVEALRNAGSTVTRERVLEELRAIEEISGDGIDGPHSPTNRVPTRCFSTVKVVGGEFKRDYPPDGGLECNLGEIYVWG